MGKKLYKIQTSLYNHPLINNASSFQLDSTTEYIQINHYVLKSKEEFDIRFNKHHTRRNINLFWDEHDQNKLIDNSGLILLLLKNNIYDKFDYHFYITYYYDLLINGIINEKDALDHFNNNGKSENRISNLNYDYEEWKKLNKQNISNSEIWKIESLKLIKQKYNV